jgi:hypothetical protein
MSQTIRRATLVPFFLLLATSVQANSGSELTPQRTLQLLDSAIHGITSFDVFVTADAEVLVKSEMVSPESKDAAGRLRPPVWKERPLREGESPEAVRTWTRQTYQLGKWRFERVKADGTSEGLISVGDLEAQKVYDKNHHRGRIQPFRGPTASDGELYAECYRSLLAGVDLVRCLRARKALSVVKIAESGNARIVLTAEAEPAESIPLNAFSVRVVMDPRRGMLPVRIELCEGVDRTPSLAASSQVFRRVTVDEWLEVGGLWVPLRATRETYSTSKASLGLPLSRVRLSVDRSRSTWNQRIPVEHFMVSFPIGTSVADELRKLTYTTGKADPGSHLADLADSAKDIVPLRPPEAPPLADAGNSGNRLRFVLIVSMGLLTILVAVALVWKRFRLRRSS